MQRREFLKRLGLGSAGIAGLSLAGCSTQEQSNSKSGEIPKDKMEYRTNPTTGDKVSLLGYGCMRWPTVGGTSAREKGNDDTIDQEQVNRLIDFAMEHGVNYYDTSPVYCKGKSEEVTGIALARHPRKNYYIATKLSNFSPDTWPREESIKMYHESLKRLQTDYIDYMLLHAIGGTAQDLQGKDLDSMETYKRRYVDNGILDFLAEERKAGRIRNLGFSYHGDIKVFDYLLSLHDKYKWDFVQIQLNYIDWQHAKEINEDNTNAEYLYDELQKRNIPAVIMEPLLGGRLATMPEYAETMMKQARPEDSVASWAFRYAGTPKSVLTVLSGMTFMEHLEDNLRTYCNFEPCTEKETAMLYKIAEGYINDPYIPCTGCQYCMPCPYGIDIPGIFAFNNKMVSEGNFDMQPGDPDYEQNRKRYLVSYNRRVPTNRQANHCIGCSKCVSHCPQSIKIPKEMQKIDQYVENLKQHAHLHKKA